MQSRDFVYWLQGFFEISNATSLDTAQTAAVKRHLEMVFKHEIDPAMGDATHQDALNKVHHGGVVAPATPQTLFRC